MKVVVITPPAPIVSIEDAMLHCKVEEPLDQPLVQAYVDAATAWLDGPAGWLGRSLGMQVLEWQLRDWPCNGEAFPYRPEIEIISIKYVDQSGVQQDLPIPDPVDFRNLPAVRGEDGDVRIRYRTGYGVLEGTAWINKPPAPIRVAILMLVGHWYQNREAVVVGSAPAELPFGVEALLSPFRVWSA
jgi:uncharacterized phiE125 gp8 family phage protein